ncbi:MAG TPA: primosomal protein N' [Spirochaetota bacterium]|nr:primosomal protein N' [Spirochaetota bacterium]
MKFADIYVSYPVESPFTYRIPEGADIQPGMRVRVHFRNRKLTGFVIKTHNNTPVDIAPEKIKSVDSAVDPEPIFDTRLLGLVDYTAKTYLCAPGEVLAAALPSAERPSARYKVPFTRKELVPYPLTGEQQQIADDIHKSREHGHQLHLIFGVTGSGKTEIYIDLAKRAIDAGRSVIYLVPEISLSSQIYERLYNIFGNDLIIYHSHLTAPQRLHNWNRFYSGDAKIAVGTRSAVFLQCPDLGLIIIDEEHDGSFKEHSTPRYNARRIATFRARQQNAALVMGSATPSVESLYTAWQGTFRLHKLSGRYGDAMLPEIRIVLLEKKRNPKDLLTNELKVATKRAVDSGSQVIYLLNRRGFSPVVLCDDCGESVTCPFCSISMNLHRDGTLLCHYCGHHIPKPGSCPSCGKKELVNVGSGTQRIEEEIFRTFPNIRVFRLDHDSSRKKDTSYNLIDQMNSGEIDILLGTQMVAKGFDFQRVTLVGVLLADIGLSLPDFRASERIFSLLTQVAGRCGRGEKSGTVIVQSLNENMPFLHYLKAHDYEGFVREELEIRQALRYPPFARIARLLVRGKSEEKVQEAAEYLGKRIAEEITRSSLQVTLLGPSPAPLGKISANFRYHLILKSQQIAPLRTLIQATRDTIGGKDLYLEIDIDPYDML